MSQETNQFVVYPDKVKNGTSIAVYGFFALLEVYVLFTSDLNMLWKILMIFLLVFLVWQVVMNIKTLMKRDPLLIISDEGVTDHTTGIDYGLIPWKSVEKIETYAGSAGLQLGIVVSKSFSFQLGNSAVAQKVANRNRQRSGYTFSIDGISFNKQTFNEIFNKMKEYGQKHNPKMVAIQYEDPFLKRAKANRLKNKKNNTQ